MKRQDPKIVGSGWEEEEGRRRRVRRAGGGGAARGPGEQPEGLGRVRS